MKKFLLLLFALVFTTLLANSQITSTILKDSITGKIPVPMQLKAGSCGSPDGAVNPTIITPPSYAWLQTNGYCNPNTYGQTPTVCWTFTPTSSSVTINSGFSTDCGSYTFNSFNLYDASCSLVGTGTNFTGLTIGVTYTWCMSGNTWNAWWQPACTGFTDFCPYFFNNSTLPIELIEFDGYNKDNVNNLYWATASEINNDYYIIENSIDGYVWTTIGTMDGAGNSNTGIVYDFEHDTNRDTVNYYRLTQVDFDGQQETFKIISIDNRIKEKTLVKTVNFMGQEVDSYEQGLFIQIYSDGTTKKVLRQ